MGEDQPELVGWVDPERDALDARIARAEVELGALLAAVAAREDAVRVFARHYWFRLGNLLAELATLEAVIARRVANSSWGGPDQEDDAEEAEARARAASSATDEAASAPPPSPPPSGDLKRLYRSLAQKVHPDLATDDEDRDWRSERMGEVNDAYARRDLGELERLMKQAAERVSDDSMSARTIDEAKERLALVLGQTEAALARLARLNASPEADLLDEYEAGQAQGQDVFVEWEQNLRAKVEQAKLMVDEGVS